MLNSSFSRRSFVQLSVGSLAALPLVADGVFALSQPSQAYAAEGPDAIHIVVVSPKQVGHYVVNQAGNKNTPIPTFIQHPIEISRKTMKR